MRTRAFLLALSLMAAVTCAQAGLAADFCPGTGAELRSSPNHIIADTLFRVPDALLRTSMSARDLPGPRPPARARSSGISELQ